MHNSQLLRLSLTGFLALAACNVDTTALFSAATTVETNTLKGIAAKGAPLANARLEVRSTAGVTATTTRADGTYELAVPAEAGPYLVRVCDGNFTGDCGGTWFYSFAASEASWANVHPLTDLILHAWYDVNADATVDAAFADTAQPAPAADEIEAIGDDVSDVVESIFPQATLLGDLLTASFAADGTGFDETLDSLGPQFIPTIEATVKFMTANPGLFTRFLLRSGKRVGLANGAPDDGDVLHAEIFAPAGTIDGAHLTCESSAAIDIELGKTPSGQSAVHGSDGFYVPGDRIDGPISGGCDLAITRAGESSPQVLHDIPVMTYDGELTLTSVSPLPLQAGVPITVQWTLPQGVTAEYLALVGWVNDSNGGFAQPEIINPDPTATSATITLPAPTNGGAVTNMGISLFVNGTNAEYAEATVSYSAP